MPIFNVLVLLFLLVKSCSALNYLELYLTFGIHSRSFWPQWQYTSSRSNSSKLSDLASPRHHSPTRVIRQASGQRRSTERPVVHARSTSQRQKDKKDICDKHRRRPCPRSPVVHARYDDKDRGRSSGSSWITGVGFVRSSSSFCSLISFCSSIFFLLVLRGGVH